MIPREKPEAEIPDFNQLTKPQDSSSKKIQVSIAGRKIISFLGNKFTFPIIIFTLLLLVLVWILWLTKMVEFGQIYSPLLTNKLLGNLSNYSLPIFGTLLFVINLILAQKAYNKERLASFFLLGAAFFVQILALILIRFYLSQGL